MNKRQRKKRLKQRTAKLRAVLSSYTGHATNLSGEVAAYLSDFYQKINSLEAEYSALLDQYILQEAKALAEQERNKPSDFEPIKEYDYYGKLQSFGLTMDEDELETVPEISRVRYFTEYYVEEYEQFVRTRGPGYMKIQEIMNGYIDIYDHMTEWYLENHYNPQRLSRTSDRIRQFAEQKYREYKARKGQQLFSRRSF